MQENASIFRTSRLPSNVSNIIYYGKNGNFLYDKICKIVFQVSVSVFEFIYKFYRCSAQTNLKLKTVLLIDDIMTTGNTANALCKKLVPMGTLNIFFASVASVEYKH